MLLLPYHKSKLIRNFKTLIVASLLLLYKYFIHLFYILVENGKDIIEINRYLIKNF